MKAKIKLRLEENIVDCYLTLYLKLENELFYRHEKTLMYQFKRTKEEFYQEVIDFVSDIDKIKKAGEDFMRDILADKVEQLQNNSKENEARQSLKKLKEPIEIEIKE